MCKCSLRSVTHWASISGTPVVRGEVRDQPRAYNWPAKWTEDSFGEWPLTPCTWCYLKKASVRTELEPTTSTWYRLLEKITFTCLLGVCGKSVFLVSEALCAVWVEEEKLKVGVDFSFLSPDEWNKAAHADARTAMWKSQYSTDSTVKPRAGKTHRPRKESGVWVRRRRSVRPCFTPQLCFLATVWGKPCL